jgi:tetratricopeptide (TPR) repeat protein
MHAYDPKDLRRLFGIPAATLQSLVRAGHINPRQEGKRARYSFQDLLVIRMVSAMAAAKIPLAKISAALDNIRDVLPGAALSQLAAATSEVPGASGSSGGVFLPAKSGGPSLAQRHFERALKAEQSDADAALDAYRASLTHDAHHVESRINLGRLLHQRGEHAAAEDVYRSGLTANALLSFNLALLLEDLDRESEAIVSYREALAQDPALADAHFNLARIHHEGGRAQESFRHLLAYRRLMRDISHTARISARTRKEPARINGSVPAKRPRRARSH